MQRTVVLLVVGLTPRLVGEHTPHLARLAKKGAQRPLATITPAVTCSVQSTFVTGALPREHGIVANGWYFRDLAEVWLWRQSNHLVAGKKVWELGRERDPSFTCAKMFWWYNMYSSADWSVTPRPMYPADGRKLPDVYAHPSELRDELNGALGTFPLFNFWGPLADLRSSRWITDATKRVFAAKQPTLTLTYLPHLDYDLQRFGPRDPRVAPALREVDALCGELIDMAEAAGARVVVLSEYGITEVSGPVHINRALRAAGLIALRREMGRELLDAGASAAFAVADHQLAHVYVRDPGRVAEVRRVLERVDGIERLLDREEQAALGLDHPRSGELVALSRADRWFTYYFWEDDAVAPDYARTVDIHRKPGYDPVELFFDPRLAFPKLKAARRVLGKKLGLRNLLDVIGLDASIVRGSHGRVTDDPDDGPVLLSNAPELIPEGPVSATSVRDLLLSHVFDGERSAQGSTASAAAPA
ncbi:MAG: alkaline phosphatase family protein [Myxococcales bacterium]|jgi:predicted AlkP superfamily pyrophosphatase or phosphodiesterase|nr:alkaline phosphatase family protein [Myxococcales bacterium]